jgi:inner membrane protein
MDPVTHTLLGAALGYATFGRRLGRTAALAGGLAAFVPDADIFIRSASDPLLAIEYHRHFTHALPFAPIGAAVVALLWLWRRAWRPEWLMLWLCCFTGYVSHCLLDAATSYGTQLFWPFSRHRAGWDLISIIDPVFTLALGAGLVFALKWRRRPVWVALAFAAVYLGFGAVHGLRAAAAQRHLAQARGHTIERREIMPTLANNVVWRALYLHNGQIHADRIRVGWFSRATVVEGWLLPVVIEAELTADERTRNRQKSFERFNWFSEGWVARKPSDPTVLGDMRYSLSTEAFDPIWGIRFTPPDAPADVAWVNHARNRRISMSGLWEEISGGDARYRTLSDAAAINRTDGAAGPSLMR